MKTNACCVCANSLSSIKSLNVGGVHLKQVILCSKVCEVVVVQAVAFVQGFLLGKVVSSFVRGQSHDSLSLNEEENSFPVKKEPFLPSPGSECNDADEPTVFFDDLKEEGKQDLTSECELSPRVPPVTLKRLSSGKYGSSSVVKATKRKVRHTKIHHKTKPPSTKSRKRQHLSQQPTRTRSKRIKSAQCLLQNSIKDEWIEESDIAVASDNNNSDSCDTEDKQWTVSCPDCGKGFNNNKTMKAHVRIKHQKNIKVCRVCGQNCYGQIGLSLHMKSKHAGEKANECEICKERFPYSTDLERHVTLVHGKDRFICHICGKNFRYWHTLQSHVKAHSGVRAYVCEHCGKGFLRGNTLIDHKKSHFCRICKKKLISGQCPDHPKPKYTYNYQSGLSLLQCKECSATFESIEALESHVKTHELQRPFHCQVCGKGFHTSQHLYKHSKQHEEKQFQCAICAKKFTYKCNMQKHQETHAEDRPFSCEFCSRTFKNKRALETHLPRHIEEKQFKCHICGKGLTRRAKLKEHLQKMHPVTS